MKNVSDSKTKLSQLMTHQFSNFMGKVHGGEIMKLMDNIAFVTASKHAGTYCVTAAVDKIEFLHPITVGDLVELEACVRYVGNTSMEIDVKIIAEDIRTGKVKHTNNCLITMVAVDENGNPKEVPMLKLVTAEQKRLFKEGEKRRKKRS